MITATAAPRPLHVCARITGIVDTRDPAAVDRAHAVLNEALVAEGLAVWDGNMVRPTPAGWLHLHLLRPYAGRA